MSLMSPAVVAGFSPLEPPGHTQYILIFNFFILSEWIYNVVFFSAVQESDSDIAGLRRYPWVAGGGHGHPLQYSCLRIPWTEEPSRLWSIDSHACMQHP